MFSFCTFGSTLAITIPQETPLGHSTFKAMHNAQLITPPSTPPHDPSGRRLPPAESRIGIFLGQTLQLRGILGTGAYGVVYSALDHATGIWYAVKALSKTNQNGEPLDRRQQEFQSREIQLHYAASAHPNIVSMLKIVDDKDCTYVVLEYCREGDLFSNITEKGRYVSNDALVQRAFLQILDAVEHCHRLGIYHRDLKPENILVSNSGADVLLADFGLATTDSISEDHGCGSTFYMSPGRRLVYSPPPLYTLTINLSECLDQSSRNPSYRCAPNDVWSLGVILVNLTCGRNPWKQASLQDSTYKAFARDRSFLKTILPLSDELNDILGMIFESNPEDRITVSQLKRRIQLCSRFSAPQQLPTPPASPVSSASDNGSLPESCGTLSDVGSDPGYESMESDSSSDEGERLHADTPETQQPDAPFAHAQVQQYVLPSQEVYARPSARPEKAVASNPYMAHNTWIQSWFSAGYSFEQPQVVAQNFQHAPYAPYPSSFQDTRDVYAY